VELNPRAARQTLPAGLHFALFTLHFSLCIARVNLAIGLRPNHEMPVVGQDALGQDADRMTLMRLDHDALKRLEAGVSAEEPHPTDIAFQNLIKLPALYIASGPGDGLEGDPARRPALVLAACPFPVPWVLSMESATSPKVVAHRSAKRLLTGSISPSERALQPLQHR
jgi:hypothetical protein